MAHRTDRHMYLCLAYEEEARLNALSPSEWESLRNATLAYVAELRTNGHLIRTHPLQSARTAVTVRVLLLFVVVRPCRIPRPRDD